VKIHEKGMQMKKSSSSKGNPMNLNPNKYRSLNHQTPNLVNHASQMTNTLPTKSDDKKKAPKCL